MKNVRTDGQPTITGFNVGYFTIAKRHSDTDTIVETVDEVVVLCAAVHIEPNQPTTCFSVVLPAPTHHFSIRVTHDLLYSDVPYPFKGHRAAGVELEGHSAARGRINIQVEVSVLSDSTNILELVVLADFEMVVVTEPSAGGVSQLQPYDVQS